MGEEIRIHWFPGHMTKARRMITENVRLVDIVCEIIDARIPVSSRNPDLDELAGTKPRLIIINRIDQADPAVTRLWAEYFRKRGIFTLEVECKTGSGVSGFPAAVREILKDKLEAYAAKGLKGRSVRAMVVGIPNVGKSSFINRVARRKVAAASDKPGVTRGKQWIKIGADLELLDTPGILWPKFDSQLVAENLAFTGAIKDDILDVETLASNLMSKLKETYPQSIENRYKISVSEDDGGFGLLEKAARKRGFLISGGEVDLERMANILLDEFRGGLLGRISLEKPPEEV
jgi:ribosome biogenesis GTPase A